MMRFRSGFISLKISTMVVILGILAAIVVPQFTEASGEAKDSRLMSDLQWVLLVHVLPGKLLISSCLKLTVAERFRNFHRLFW